MNENEARRVLLIRALETEDREAVLLPESAQRALKAAIGPPPPAQPAAAATLGEAQQRFLARRADALLEIIRERFPALATLQGGHGRWLGFLLPLAAFLFGAVFQDLAPQGRINILAFPLLAMLLWNLAVYALLAFHALRGTPVSAANGGHRLRSAVSQGLTFTVRGLRRLGDDQKLLAPALLRFGEDWARRSAPLLGARSARVLHGAAALLAAGFIAGLYVRGLGFEYRAGWESTFLDAGTVGRIVGTVLAPASVLNGVPLPGAGEWEALRFGPGHSGENAARWIHLYALTALLFIILPRLALALVAWRRERALAADFPLPPAGDPYFRRLLATSETALALRIVAYSYHLSAAAQEQLRHVLRQALGEGLRISEPEVIDYGDEDDFIDRAAAENDAADTLVIVFSLAATPEHETHTRLCDGLAQQLALGKFAHRMMVLVDESPYRLRLAGEAGAAERLAQRRANWREAMAGHRIVMIDLAAPAAAMTDALDALRERGEQTA